MDNSPLWIEPGDWASYENYVAGALASEFPNVILDINVKLPGLKSGTRRQIDILVKSPMTVAIDCKYYKRKVDVKCVEAFLGMLDDLGISSGVLVTAKGHTKAALTRAKNDYRHIELQILPPNRLSEFQFLGAPLIWRGSLGIFLDAPKGWVTDNEMLNKPNGAAVMFYPLGFTLPTAMKHGSVIYANFLSKPTHSSTLEEIAAPHEADLKVLYVDYIFSFSHQSISDLRGVTRETLLRKADGGANIYGQEHALYVDYGELVLLLVLNSQPGRSEELLPFLLELYEGSLEMKILHAPALDERVA